MSTDSSIPLTEELARAVFDQLIEPKLKWTINSLNLLQHLEVEGSTVRIEVHLVSDDAEENRKFEEKVRAIFCELGATTVDLTIRRVHIATQGIEGVRHVFLVGSGKGGVGKSHVAVNLAVALSKQGQTVGLMDADLYGPSIPTMLGTRDKKPEVLPEEYLRPVEAHGLRTMSVGYLIEPQQALSWRGNLASGTILQFIRKTLWGNLDSLIIDMPPGTGDIQLTIAHQLKTSGMIFVATPQEVVLGDLRRALQLCREREIPILGLVENMGALACEACGHINHPFPAPAEPMKDDPLAELPLLAKIPLHHEIATAADQGVPIALSTGHPVQEVFDQLASTIREKFP